jgi:hypothetical protein
VALNITCRGRGGPAQPSRPPPRIYGYPRAQRQSADPRHRHTVKQLRAANEKAHDQRIEACGKTAAEVTAMMALGLLKDAPAVEAAPKAELIAAAEKKLRYNSSCPLPDRRGTRSLYARAYRGSNPTPSAKTPLWDIGGRRRVEEGDRLDQTYWAQPVGGRNARVGREGNARAHR